MSNTIELDSSIVGIDGIVSSNNDGVKKGLNIWRLVSLTFFTVAGGPYGLEQLVSTGGPLFSIVGIILIPWVCFDLFAYLVICLLTCALFIFFFSIISIFIMEKISF